MMGDELWLTICIQIYPKGVQWGFKSSAMQCTSSVKTGASTSVSLLKFRGQSLRLVLTRRVQVITIDPLNESFNL